MEVGGFLWGGMGWDEMGWERERERETSSSELWYSVVCLYVCMYVCTRSGICSLGLFQDLNRGPTTLRAPKLPTYDLCAI